MTVDNDAFYDFYDDAPALPKYGINLPGKPVGRYIFPDPPGFVRRKGMRPGFMRMTNLAASFSDQRALMLWRERMIVAGLRTEEGETLYDEWMSHDVRDLTDAEVRDVMNKYADRFADAAKASLAARRGTARHAMLQTYAETGVITGTRTMRLQMESLLRALEAHELDILPGWSERRVCNTEFQVMGTLDLGVMCRRTGQVGVLDLKTQRKFWTYQEVAGQQYGYDSAEWVWSGPPNDDGFWVEAPEWSLTGRDGGEFEGRRVALLAHMPQEPGEGQLPVEIHEVALDFGRDVLLTAYRNVQLRSQGESVAKGRRVGSKRPLTLPL